MDVFSPQSFSRAEKRRDKICSTSIIIKVVLMSPLELRTALGGFGWSCAQIQACRLVLRETSFTSNLLVCQEEEAATSMSFDFG